MHAKDETEAKKLTTTTVVNRCRVFRDVTLNPSKCRTAMISILQAISQNAKFNEKERTEIFFSLTQLFHSTDTYIHRLLILLLKEIPVNIHNSIIITHSLSKDICGNEVTSQGHAIRCLCSILDAGNVLLFERYLKVAIVSQTPYTSSAALCGALHLIEQGRKDAVMRWLPEILQASKSTQRSVRYHALLLLYLLKKNDSYASAQLVSKLEDPKSQMEQYISIAIASQSLNVKNSENVIEYLKRCMTSGSPMVRLEALRKAPEELSSSSVEVISYLLRGSNLKCFAALRTIANSENIQKYESLLPQIFKLTKSTNTSLEAIAIICALKLTNESNTEMITKRILKSCKNWANPLIRSVAEESCKFAAKYKNEQLTEVAVFLLHVASDVSSKFFILKSLLKTEGIPRKYLIPRLSEYLEDWDSVSIARIICDFIAKECKEMNDPSSLIPVLFNRINLDVSSVRMAAVNTLAIIGYNHESMKEKIIPLLELFVNDEDDSLREEVILYINALKNGFDLSKLLTPFSFDENVEDKPSNVETNVDDVITESERFVPVSMNPEFDKYGKLEFKTDPIDLTDQDSEFVISYIVNVYSKHIILEFLCTNTVEGVDIYNVSVLLSDINVIDATKVDSIKYQQTASMCCVLEKNSKMVFERLKATLLYSQEDEDDQDEWELNDIILGLSTWFRPVKIKDFTGLYDSMQDTEVASVFQIQGARGTSQGISKVEAAIPLYKISEEKDTKKTTIYFYGKGIDNSNLFIMAQLGIAKSKGVICRISVRSTSSEVSESIIKTLSF